MSYITPCLFQCDVWSQRFFHLFSCSHCWHSLQLQGGEWQRLGIHTSHLIVYIHNNSYPFYVHPCKGVVKLVLRTALFYLQNAGDSTAESLAKLQLKKLVTAVDMKSDSSLTVHLSLGGCELEDTRPHHVTGITRYFVVTKYSSVICELCCIHNYSYFIFTLYYCFMSWRACCPVT